MSRNPPPIPTRLYPLRPHPVHERLKRSKKRFCVVPAGRRSGKTELAKRKLVRAALMCMGYADANFFAGAPTRDQAKAIWWNDLKAMTPPSMIDDIRESDLSIRLITGTTTFVVGMDKPARIEGRPWNGGVLDEYANMKPGAWGENVRPALSDRKGWCWLIGVPEGRNHYYKLNQYALSGVDPEWESFTWKSADIIDSKEVEAARRQLDELVFQQEYEASFVNFVGRIYYTFLQDNQRPLRYDPLKELGFCFDFNVDPGVAVVVQEQRMPGQFERDYETGVQLLDEPVFGTGCIGEVYIPQNSNTPAVCNKLIKDWGDHQGMIRCYGDATGGARGTAQLDGSDWDIIKRMMRAKFGERVSFEVDSSNPTERARVNAMNSRIRSGRADKAVLHLMVDPTECPHLVIDLEGTKALEGGSGEIDKKSDLTLTHMSDALGYYVERRYPTTNREAVVDYNQRY
jgi:hypothetical protein